MKNTEKIVSALEEALATVTPGDWHYDDNFALSVTSDDPLAMAVLHSLGRNGESDMRYIALCSPENIRTLLAEHRALLAAHEQEPDYIRYDCGCCGFETLEEWRDNDVCPKCNHKPMGKTELFTHSAPSIPAVLPPEIARDNTDGWWMYKGARVGGGAAEWYNKAIADAKALETVPDYFAGLVAAARRHADKAIRKYPQPNYVLNKVAEESGEVIKAVIHYTEGREEWSNVEAEIIDNLAMLIRLVTEGDQVIGFTPPDACRAAMLNLSGSGHHEKPSS